MSSLLISKIGGNHKGDSKVGKRMVQLAIDRGSGCVKFQLYTGDVLFSPVESPTRNQHFMMFELPKHQHLYLAQMCRSAGVSYNAFVWDLSILDWIDEYLDLYERRSGYFTTGTDPFFRTLDSVIFTHEKSYAYGSKTVHNSLQSRGGSRGH